MFQIVSVLHCSMIPIRVIATKIPTSLHKIANSGLRIKMLYTISHNEPSVSFLSFFLVSFFQKKERGKHFNWSEKNVNAKAVGTRYIVFVLYMYVYLVWLFIICLLTYLYPESLNLMCGDCTMHRTYCQIKSVIHYL